MSTYAHFLKKPDRTASDVMAAILKGAAENDVVERGKVVPLRRPRVRREA